MFGFSDETYIDVASGNGGAGCVSFHREKFVPKGGPDGGDGGKGGDVVFVVKSNLRTLGHLKATRAFKAENGRPGQGDRCFGRAASYQSRGIPRRFGRPMHAGPGGWSWRSRQDRQAQDLPRRRRAAEHIRFSAACSGSSDGWEPSNRLTGSNAVHRLAKGTEHCTPRRSTLGCCPRYTSTPPRYPHRLQIGQSPPESNHHT